MIRIQSLTGFRGSCYWWIFLFTAQAPLFQNMFADIPLRQSVLVDRSVKNSPHLKRDRKVVFQLSIFRCASFRGSKKLWVFGDHRRYSLKNMFAKLHMFRWVELSGCIHWSSIPTTGHPGISFQSGIPGGRVVFFGHLNWWPLVVLGEFTQMHWIWHGHTVLFSLKFEKWTKTFLLFQDLRSTRASFFGRKLLPLAGTQFFPQVWYPDFKSTLVYGVGPSVRYDYDESISGPSSLETESIINVVNSPF